MYKVVESEYRVRDDLTVSVRVRVKRFILVTSLCVGSTYGRHFESEKHDTVRLNSGDVLLFGGPSRMIVHSVTRVIPRTMPSMMRGKMLHGRLNVTVRDIGRGVIDTSMFPAYRVSYDNVVSSDQI